MITDWEEIPGIDEVIERAKGCLTGWNAIETALIAFLSAFWQGRFHTPWSGIQTVVFLQGLELKQPLRNLNDLFYESQPEELPWIRTECVIDVVQAGVLANSADWTLIIAVRPRDALVVQLSAGCLHAYLRVCRQAAAYLGQAVVFLYKAIDYDGLKCPDNSPVGCAASVAGFITSVTWIASYLSFAANACGQAVNSGALCAGDWTALMANFGEMATVGAAVKEDCDFSKNYLALLELVDAPDDTPAWRAFIPPSAVNTVDTITKVDALKTATGHDNL